VRASYSAAREVVVTRIFDATREMIWDAWTDPEQVALWWGPQGFRLTVYEMDVRPGGVWKSVMHGPDATDYANDCEFLDVVKPERIVYRLIGGGKLTERDMDAEIHWTFEAVGKEKTRLTMRMIFPSAAHRALEEGRHGVREGGEETLDRLAEHLRTRA
jgi:uncharacterized protein YndB with AHSA1/START domain